MVETRSDHNINISLDSRQYRELAALLKQCNSISDPNQRKFVVDDLEGDFKVSITQTRDNTLVDIRYIIDICVQHNNFKYLIDAMQFFDQDAPPLQNVQGFIDDIYKIAYINEVSVRKKEQYDALDKILSTITVKQLEKLDLEQLYASSVPDDITDKWDYPRKDSQRATLMAIIEKLKGAVPQKGELYANQKFIIGLALQLPEKKHAGLDDWIDSTTEPWGTDKQRISIFRDEAEKKRQQRKTAKDAPPLPQPPHLLISLEAPKDITREKAQLDKHDETKFCVTAWLFYGKDNMKCIHMSEANEFYTSTTMPRLLAKLRSQIDQSTEIEEPELKLQTVIDFFLKREFFVLPVERWTINETSQTAIGKYQPVVIRSFERLAERHSSLWKVKWGQVHNPAPSTHQEYVHWICNRDELSNKALEDDLLPEYITCLGLTLAPLVQDNACNDTELFYNLLNSLSNTGTPIALWLRDLPDTEDQEKLRELVNLLLSRRYISQLPQVLRKGKMEGLQKKNKEWQKRLLNRLVLLWEDPDVIPSDIPMQVPEIR